MTCETFVSRNPTNSSVRWSLETNVLVKCTMLADSSTMVEELNRSETFGPKRKTPTVVVEQRGGPYVRMEGWFLLRQPRAIACGCSCIDCVRGIGDRALLPKS